MKKIYIAPAVNVTRMQIESMVCKSLDTKDTPITSETQGFTKAANDRRSVNEDGLRDWNINLW